MRYDGPVGRQSAQVAPDVAVHQLDDRVADLAQRRIMGGFDDADVEGEVAFDLRLEVVGGERGIQCLEGLADAATIDILRVACSQAGSVGFDQFADVEQVVALVERRGGVPAATGSMSPALGALTRDPRSSVASLSCNGAFSGRSSTNIVPRSVSLLTRMRPPSVWVARR